MMDVGSYRPGPDMTGLLKYLQSPNVSTGFNRTCMISINSVCLQRSEICRTVALPVDVVGDQRSIEGNTEPLPGAQEEEVEQDVEDVLRQHQRVQAGALVYRILVICF